MFCDSYFSEARSLSLVFNLEDMIQTFFNQSGFSWVSILIHKIASTSGKYVLPLLLHCQKRPSSRGRKMVVNADSLRFTSFNSSIDCYFEVFPSCISNSGWLKIPGKLYFYFDFTTIAINRTKEVLYWIV